MRGNSYITFASLDSPVGTLLVTSAEHRLTGIYWDNGARLATALHGDPKACQQRDALLERTIDQLQGYFEGNTAEFELPIAPHGTPFQQRVWQCLTTIPRGETRSYGELARQLGMPKGARAVGTAVGKNPIAIVLPCHRVVGRDGSLTGFSGGLTNKRWLLEHEASLSAPA